MKNQIEEFEKHPILSEFGFWKYKQSLKIEMMELALDALKVSASLDGAKEALTHIRDSYALASWPGGLRKDESTDHQL
jgi:hypothetical protein